MDKTLNRVQEWALHNERKAHTGFVAFFAVFWVWNGTDAVLNRTVWRRLVSFLVACLCAVLFFQHLRLRNQAKAEERKVRVVERLSNGAEITLTFPEETDPIAAIREADNWRRVIDKGLES